MSIDPQRSQAPQDGGARSVFPNGAPVASSEPPGHTLGLVGLILAILLPPVGWILSGIARSQSRKAGVPNALAKAGVIVGMILTILGIIAVVAYLALWFILFAQAVERAALLG